MLTLHRPYSLKITCVKSVWGIFHRNKIKHHLVYCVNNYLLSGYYISDIVLVSGDTAGNKKNMVPTVMDFLIYRGRIILNN